jgi:hypothetical protein
MGRQHLDLFAFLLAFLLICFSLFLIWKFLDYHLYKIRQFFRKTAFFKFVPDYEDSKNNNKKNEDKDFFRFPLSPLYYCCVLLILAAPHF